MKASWTIDKATLKRWKTFVEQNKDNELPKRRRRRNVQRKDIDLSQSAIWRVLVGCQITTQQRSGPGSPVHSFMQSKSPALSLSICQKSKSLDKLLEQECQSARLRRGKIIAKNLVNILDYLESGGWEYLIEQLNSLVKNTTIAKERNVVNFLLTDRKFPGLGQKQARNFIQWLGLSRYEIPLDSRVMKKMEQMGATYLPTAKSLVDKATYEFVQEGLQMLANKLGIYPCELDACIFSSFDVQSDEEVGEY